MNKKIIYIILVLCLGIIITVIYPNITKQKYSSYGIPLDSAYRGTCPFEYGILNADEDFGRSLVVGYENYFSLISYKCSLDFENKFEGEQILIYIYSPILQEGLDKFIEVVKSKGIDFDPASIDYQWFNPNIKGLRYEDYPEEFYFTHCVGYDYRQHGVNHQCNDGAANILQGVDIQKYFEENNLEEIGDLNNRKIINTLTGEVVDPDGL